MFVEVILIAKTKRYMYRLRICFNETTTKYFRLEMDACTIILFIYFSTMMMLLTLSEMLFFFLGLYFSLNILPTAHSIEIIETSTESIHSCTHKEKHLRFRFSFRHSISTYDMIKVKMMKLPHDYIHRLFGVK